MVLLRDADGRLRAAAVLLTRGGSGSAAVALAGTECGYRGVVLARSPDAARALGHAVGEALRPRRQRVVLGPLPAASPLVGAFVSGLPGSFTVVNCDPVPLLRRRQQARDVAGYLSDGTRRTLRQAGNRLTSDGRRSAVEFVTDPPTILGLLPVLERCHRDRDHVQGRPSALDDAVGRAAWQSRLRVLAASGRLELAVLRIDGLFAAYVLGLVQGSSYQIWEGRFRSEWARYAPGRVLETAVVQRMLDDPALAVVDWMTSIAPETLLAANDLDPMVTLHRPAAR